MPSLTLKEIPDELMLRLRAAARRQRRSIVQEALHLIEGGLSREGYPGSEIPPEVADQVARWRAIAGQWESDLSLDDEVRSLSEARTDGRSVDL